MGSFIMNANIYEYQCVVCKYWKPFLNCYFENKGVIRDGEKIHKLMKSIGEGKYLDESL